MTKTAKLPILSIQFNKTTGKYVVITAPSKANPFGETGVCQLTAKQLENMASKTAAGTAASLINLVGFGDASLNVVITGTHKQGDLVLNSDGEPIEVPVNERGTEAGQKATNAEGFQIFKSDGFNFDQLGYAVELGNAALLHKQIADSYVDRMFGNAARPAAVAATSTVAETADTQVG